MSVMKPAVAAPAVKANPAKSATTVIVVSKLPFSIWLHIDKPITKSVPGRYGSEPETVYYPGKQYYIRGTQEPAGQAPKGYRKPTIVGAENAVEGGFALTSGIPLDFWEGWLEQHKETDMVVNGLIFAHASRDHAEGHAEDHRALRTGLEPIDGENPAKDPRMPRSVNVAEIENVERGTRDEAA